MHSIPSVKSTAKRAPAATSYKPGVKLTAHRGWYRVQSGTRADVWYETSANSCTCPARKPCKHQTFVLSLNVAFFVKKEAEAPVSVPMTAGAPSGIVRPVRGGQVAGPMTAAAQLLAHALRALADAHEQSDERAVLMRRVDELERQVAADNASAMRAA